jgi:5-methylthioadenosine/S-adenosylhomocysteine deaminase
MATINGARALGLAEQIGSLQPGKWADLIAVDLDHPATQPVHNPLSQLVYAASREQVSDVWVGGQPLLELGQFTRAEVGATLARAEAWRRRLATPAEQP